VRFFVNLLAQRYGYLRQFVPEFLSVLAFRSNAGGASLLRAVDLLRELDAQGLRKLPDDAPTDFIPAKWRSYVVSADGQLDRKYFELEKGRTTRRNREEGGWQEGRAEGNGLAGRPGVRTGEGVRGRFP
jgi:hypothetical protein